MGLQAMFGRSAALAIVAALAAGASLRAGDVSANMEDLLKIESPTLTAAGSMRTLGPLPGATKVDVRFAVRFTTIDTGGVPFVVDRSTFKASVSGVKSSTFTQSFTEVRENGELVGMETTLSMTPKAKDKKITFKAKVKSLIGSNSLLIPKTTTIKDTDKVQFVLSPNPGTVGPDLSNNTAPPSIDTFEVSMRGFDYSCMNSESEVRNPTTNALISRPSYETEAVWFYALYSDADWYISAYSLDFGDGSAPAYQRETLPGQGIGGGGNQYHYYTDAGSYTATLTVTDYHGATTSISQTVYVQARMIELKGGVIEYQSHPNYPTYGIPVFVEKTTFAVGEEVKFMGSWFEAGGGGDVSLDFGDGSEPVGNDILGSVGGLNGFRPFADPYDPDRTYVGYGHPGPHVYAAPGTYTVTLTSRIRDGFPASGGQVRTRTWQVTITE